MNYNVLDIDLSTKEKLGFTVYSSSDSSLRVKHVDPLGTAHKAGIKEDDCILMINGTEVKNTTDLKHCDSYSKEKVNIKVKRLNDLGSKHSASVNELNNLTRRRYSTDVETSQYSRINSRPGIKPGMDIQGLQVPRKMSLDIRSTITPQCLQLSDNILHTINDSDDTSDVETGSSVPVPRKMSIQLNKRENCSSSQVKEFSNRKSSFTSVPTLLGNSTNKVRSRTIPHSESSDSLFDSSAPSNSIVDYLIDWQAIYRKISSSISCSIEVELVNYFRNTTVDLSKFPLNCLHRFITFDDVLEHVFCNVLSLDCVPDLEEELRKIGSKMCQSDYALVDFDILKIIRCYISRSNEIINGYRERKISLDNKLGQLKESLHPFLKKIDKQSIAKLDKEIDKIIEKLLLLISFLVQLATSMSMWKFSVDVPSLFPSELPKPSPSSTWQINVSDFKSSEKIIHQQIINLFKLFKDDCHTEALNVFDGIFSENIEVSICLSILKEKNDKDTKIEKVLMTFPPSVGKQEQFV